MRILRWDISRPRAFLIGGIVLIGAFLAAVALFSDRVVVPEASFSVASGKEIGTWIWDPVNRMSTSTMQDLVNEAAANHFNVIYLSIDPYLAISAMPDGAAKQQAFQNFNSAAYDFVSIAHQKNIAVDAEAGEIDWGEPQYYQKAYDILNFVQSFNASHDGKFRGMQYDVESYSLPQYRSDPATVLMNYVGLVEGLVNQDQAAAGPSSPSSTSSQPPLPLTMIVPYFFTSDHSSVPQITIDGITDYPFSHIVRVLNTLPPGNGRVIVLAYRNIASGFDGTVNLAQAEVSAANSTNVPVIIAQETGNVQPASITFYGMTKDDLYGAISEINGAYLSDHSYGGVAVDYLQAFTALP